MSSKFRKVFFGFDPGEVTNEIKNIDLEYQKRIAALQAEIEGVKEELNESEKKAEDLRQRLNSYMERELLIAEVMLTAQKNAQRIEEEAREKARIMLEKSDEELKKKLQELDFLRKKVERFKEEFREVLDKYKFSLETMKDPSGETTFVPTLIVNDKLQAAGKNQDISS